MSLLKNSVGFVLTKVGRVIPRKRNGLIENEIENEYRHFVNRTDEFGLSGDIDEYFRFIFYEFEDINQTLAR